MRPVVISVPKSWTTRASVAAANHDDPHHPRSVTKFTPLCCRGARVGTCTSRRSKAAAASSPRCSGGGSSPSSRPRPPWLGCAYSSRASSRPTASCFSWCSPTSTRSVLSDRSAGLVVALLRPSPTRLRATPHCVSLTFPPVPSFTCSRTFVVCFPAPVKTLHVHPPK